MDAMEKKPLLVLVDGSAVFHRGYHAIPHLSNRAGEPTNATYGFLAILLKVLGDQRPDYVIVAWDKGDETVFRKKLYPEYKAHRAAPPPDLFVQKPDTKALVGALGLPWIEVAGYEADDIIGTLARKAEARGDVEIVIATGDKDQLQLVDRATVVDIFNPRGLEPTRYDLAKMQERYGLTPAQFIDYKALVGDASDNIPGVKGIGDKGAIKLLADYGTLDGIYEHVDEIAGSVGEKLRVGKDMAYLSRTLSVIVCDMDLELDLEEARVGRYDREKLDELFRRLDFKPALLNRLPAGSASGGSDKGGERAAVGEKFGGGEGELTLFGPAEGTAKRERAHLGTVTYTAIRDMAALRELAAELAKQVVFAFDTETTGVDTLVADLVGISVAFEEGVAYYIPVGHVQGTQLVRDEALAVLRPVLEDPKIGKVGHNLKFDYEVMAKHGVRVRGIVFDTMIAAFLVNGTGRGPSLDDLAYSELGIEMIPISELIGTGRNQVTFDKAEIEAATTYAAEDADMSWRLYERLRRALAEATPVNQYGWTVERLADEIEWPIVTVLADMELTGIGLDSGFLERFGEKLRGQIRELKEQIYGLVGEEFNLESPTQLGQILYGRLGLSVVGVKKGKTGLSTAATELEKLRDAHPMIPLLMQYRELTKLASTYVEALPAAVAADGRVHTNFSQAIVPSGRLSSNNPNLQNIPVRTENGREIRTAFVAPAGRVLVGADYSQIELRVAAALSGDEAMIETFRSGADLHVETAAELFGVEASEVTRAQRAAAKTINFGVLYGMSAHGLSVATGMGVREAQGFIDRYFEIRPRLRGYLDALKQQAYNEGYVATWFNRRRLVPEVRSANYMHRQAAERVALNIPIQGTAADIYKLAMIAVTQRLDSGAFGEAKLLLQIHDELIVEAPEEQAEAVAVMMRQVMEGVIDIGVPLMVETAVGRNWGELKG